MWLDDDGEDDPISWPVPDPSARQWRHPSEIAAENARTAELAMSAQLHGGGRQTTWSGSILWPITVVGGSIAVAAFGVLGLYLMGNAAVDEVTAGGAEPMGIIGSSLPVQARSIPDRPASSGKELYSKDEQTAGEATPGGRGTDGEQGSDHDRAGAPGTTTSTVPPRTDPTTNTPRSTTTLKARPVQPVGPAIYADDDLTSKRLASLVPTGGYLMTSASALGGRTEVFLWIGRRWFEAVVAGTDMSTDVAVLTAVEPAAELGLPAISMVHETVDSGAAAYVGYCRSEIGSGRAAGAAVGPQDESEPPPAGPNDPAAGPDQRMAPGCGDGRTEPAADDAPYEGPITDTDPEPSPEFGLPKPPNNWGVQPTPEWSDDPSRPSAPHGDDRSGLIISTDDVAKTLADHIIYEPIRTGIRRSEGLAGAPLRDRLGRVVGLVIGSRDYHISAVPIDRAVSIAESLMRRGMGSSAWVGIGGRTTPIGMEVHVVDENGPAAGLVKTGDTLLTVDGEQLMGSDHMTHLVREAGVGQTLTFSLWRDSVGRRTVTVDILDNPN